MVCLALRSSSKRASPRSMRSSVRDRRYLCTFGKDTKGKRKIIILSPQIGEPMEYLIPKGKHISTVRGRRSREAPVSG